MTKDSKGFGFGINKMKQFATALQKAQQMQEDAKKLQEELENMRIEGTSGDGLITVVMTGNQEPIQVVINPEAVTKSPEALSESVTSAMKNAYQKSKENMEQRMQELTSSLNLPGLE